MFVMENVPLSGYSAMRLGGNSRYLTELNEVSDIADAVKWAEDRGLPISVVGSGSNVVWSDAGFSGLVLVNKILGFETFQEDRDNIYATVGAGENWDQIVGKTVSMGYSGVEYLSLIPGTAGATPVQNVGAYGHEIAEVLTTVQAFDMNTHQMVTIRGSECEFTYRSSRFKTTDKNRFIIANITLHLSATTPKGPFYKDIEDYLAKQNNHKPTISDIRTAVIAIRSAKLPNVNMVANCGSFFGNPVVEKMYFTELLDQHPELASSQSKWTQKPFWEQSDGTVKISAARLMELSGFDDIHDKETGIGQWPKQNLILVNESARSTANLLTFRQKVVDAVKAKFGIELQQEPELLGDPSI